MPANSQQEAQFYAQLQTLGIDVYQDVEQIAVDELPWLEDACLILGISLDKCVFDAQTPKYDAELNILHLPKSSFSSELAFKKALWQSISPFVSL
jgi:hypothetical protein